MSPQRCGVVLDGAGRVSVSIDRSVCDERMSIDTLDSVVLRAQVEWRRAQ